MGPLKNVDDWIKIETTPTIYYESFFHWYKSDHCAMIIDITSKILFGNYTISPFDPVGQGFSSKDVKAALIYLHNIYKHLMCQNIPWRVDIFLKYKKINHKEAEKINKQIMAGCKNGEKNHHQRWCEYWTVEIHKIRRELVIWCTLKYRKKTEAG